MTEIFIVSYWKDAEWLGWCLRSIKKFASGFSGVTVVAPTEKSDVIRGHCDALGAKFKSFEEKEGKGFLHHLALICSADQFTDSDLVLHMDSDTIFVEPVTPEDYLVDGKPVLLIEEYERFRTKHKEVFYWKEGTELALGRECKYESMRRHPAVHYRWLYPIVRQRVEEAQKRPFLEFMLAGQNAWPQNRGDFNLLGAVAHAEFHLQYHWVDLATEPRPKDKLCQFWSHSPVTAPINTAFNGLITPVELFTQLKI